MRAWSCLLETIRRMEQSPEESLVEAGVIRAIKVADIGAGYGYFALPAAEIVGGGGMVYAVEPDTRRAEEISRRVRAMGTKNIAVLRNTAEDLHEIETGSIDLAMSFSAFHHFHDIERALKEVKRIVKAGGAIYIRDIKAGRIFKHGSNMREFREAVSRHFPQAEFEDGSGYVVARVRL